MPRIMPDEFEDSEYVERICLSYADSIDRVRELERQGFLPATDRDEDRDP